MQRIANRFGRRLKAWLEAEQAGDEARSERHLGRAFQRLDLPQPSVDLVAGTMRRLGLVIVPHRAPEPGRLFKAAVSFSLTVAFGVLLIAPSVVVPWLAPWLVSVRPSWLVDGSTAVLVGLSQRLASGLTVWRVLERVGDAFAELLASPTVFAVLSLAVIITFVSFRALSQLMRFERSAGNA